MRYQAVKKNNSFQTFVKTGLFLRPAVFLFMACLSYPLPLSAAVPVQAVHRLSISFDIDNNCMAAVSHIELPPGKGAGLRLDKLDITGITINGKKALPQSEKNYLKVPPASAKQEVIITFQKKAPFSMGLVENLISPKGIVLTRYWHPLPDREMLFKLTASIPLTFEAVSEADDIITTSTPEGKRVIFTFPHMVRSIHFAAGPYIVNRTSFSLGKELLTYFFPEDRNLAGSYQKKAYDYLNSFEKLFGQYPYHRFAIVENRLPTGFTMPTFTLLGQAVVRLPFIKDTSLGHEVLHAWLGNGIEISPKGGNWAEGLTTYLADQAFARDNGHDISFRKTQIVEYMSYVNTGNAISLNGFFGAGHHDYGARALRSVGYNKCSMFFHMLKQRVGEDAFFKALRDFYHRMKYRSASWSDLRSSFERFSNKKIADFFGQWLTRNDIPRLDVRRLSLEERSGRQILSFLLIQENDTPYSLDVPLTVKTTRGEIHEVINTTGSETSVEIQLDASPIELILDGKYDLMRELTRKELPAVWSRFIGARNKTAILSSPEGAQLYGPLIDLLKGMNCRIMGEREVTDSDLLKGAVIFLGTEGRTCRSIFGRPFLPSVGFTIDVRENPLAGTQVAVLVAAKNRDEVSRIIRKLSHYGKYGYLHFEKGRIKEKRIPKTHSGQRLPLEPPPRGVKVEKIETFEEIVKKLLENRVIYVGESHTRYEDHRLQLRIIHALYEHDSRIAIGMEMFPQTAQPVLDEYISNRLKEREFLKKSGYFRHWGYDYRLYREIIDFARSRQIPIVALNLDKEIVSKVFKGGGISALSPEEQESLPLNRDLDVPGYRERLEPVYRMHFSDGVSGRFGNFLQAQALWDETMAEGVAKYLASHPERRIVVLAGKGHVIKDTGIPQRVHRRTPLVQAVVLNEEGQGVDPAGADFIFFSRPARLPPQAMLGVMLTDGGNGIKVASLTPHGRAKASGLKKGDIIVAIDDETLKTVEDLKIIMLYKKKGDTARIRIKRSHALLPDEEIEISVKL